MKAVAAALAECPMLAEAAARMTPYAIDYRYPEGPQVEGPEQVAEALDDAETIYRQALAFPGGVHREKQRVCVGQIDGARIGFDGLLEVASAMLAPAL